MGGRGAGEREINYATGATNVTNGTHRCACAHARAHTRLIKKYTKAFSKLDHRLQGPRSNEPITDYASISDFVTN